MKFEDLTGQKFGRLTVIEQAETHITPCGSHKTQWLCECSCGNRKIIRSNDLKNGRVLSCGCLGLEKFKERITKHNACYTRLYRIYKKMFQRVQNPNCKQYKWYGGRGISICKEWESFDNFHNWAMANGYKENLSIDRIDVNGDYCPENCRWVTHKEQMRNTRRNVFVLYNNEKHCISEWAEILKLDYDMLRYRAKKGLKLCKQ